MRVSPVVGAFCLCAAVAEGQSFTTVAEIKPILTATQADWITLREWQGQDLVYFTQLENWRCGLSEIRYSVNGGPEQLKPMERCYRNAPSPNAFEDPAHKPYVALPSGSVQQVLVKVTYSDGSTAQAGFDRAQIALR